MCAVKSPKITPQEQKAPKPVVIRNPYLDNDPALKAQRLGRSQLRIDPGSTRKTTPAPGLPMMGGVVPAGSSAVSQSADRILRSLRIPTGAISV